MIENPVTKSLQPFDFTHLIDNVPKIKKLNYSINNIQFHPPIDSSNMNPSHWVEIAQSIEENYASYDGFVVLHGTDTMAYTASALSFMLENLHKPVIITGSQLPIGEVRTDGEENLITALQIAAARDKNGDPMVQEVAILFEDYLWRGNRSTKRSSDQFEAFESPNDAPLAHAGIQIEYKKRILRPASSEPFRLQPFKELPIGVIKIFPGIQFDYFESLMTDKLKGVVLETFGAGNIPGSAQNALLPIIDRAYKNGTIITVCSQCSQGAVSLGTYAASSALRRVGAVNGRDMTTEAALAKSYYLLSISDDMAFVKAQMQRNLCGELTE